MEALAFQLGGLGWTAMTRAKQKREWRQSRPASEDGLPAWGALAVSTDDLRKRGPRVGQEGSPRLPGAAEKM